MTNKIRPILAVAALIFGISLVGTAQTSFGVKSSVGVTLAGDEVSYSGEVFDYINHEVTYKGSNIVKSYGLFAQKKFGYLYGRTELSFTHFTQEYNVRSFVQLGQVPRKEFEDFQFVDFQVMAGVTKNNIRFGVGPVAHILVGHNNDLDFISGYNEKLRGMTFGFAGSVGLDAGRFHLDVKYENNFRTVGDHIYYGTRSARFDNKPNVVSLTLGISI